MTNTVIGTPIQSSEPRTKWLRFYLNVYLFLKLISVVVAIPSIFSIFPIIAEWVAKGYNLYAIAGIAPIIVILSTIMTFIKTRKLTPSGYKWNSVMIWSNFVGFALWMFLLEMNYRLSGAYTPPGFTFVAIMLYLLGWTVPNLVYFHNRRQLFHIDTGVEQAATTPSEPIGQVLVRPVRKPCHYKPTKARIDTQKLCGTGNGITRLVVLTRKKREL